MENIRQINQLAYDYLVKRNPNSWSWAFFEMDRRCAAFENDIRAIQMNKVAFRLGDRITLSIRKRLEVLKRNKAYMHLNQDIYVGVSYWYSQEAWFHAYQFSIKPVIGSKYWKKTNDVTPLPPLCRKLPGRRGGGRGGRGGRSSGTTGGNPGTGAETSETAMETLAKVEVLEKEVGGVEEDVRWVEEEVGGVEEEEYQLMQDREIFREYMEEEARNEPEYVKSEEANEGSKDDQSTDFDVTVVGDQPINEDVAAYLDEAGEVAALDNGKGKAMDEATDVAAQPTKKRNMQKWQEQAYVDGVRVFVKNCGRSERIEKQKMSKPFKFDHLGTRSTLEKAFDVFESS
ncbi:hypothetical protein Tco_0711773 [Tanacetum coccineum]